MWIRIEMASLDPDPYWEYGYGSGSRTAKMASKEEKKHLFQVEKSIDYFPEDLMVLDEPGSP